LKKQILCYYNTQTDKESFDILQSVLNEYTIQSTSSQAEAKSLFNANNYELILIDFTKNEGKDFLKYTMSKNISQKVITMSDNFECSEFSGCNSCIETYKRKRVFRPLNLKELIDVIKNFDEQSCSYMHKFNNIMNLLDKILEDFNHFLYDSIKKRIYPKNSVSESALIEEILEVTVLLQDNHIKFQVDEHYNINLTI